MSPEDHSRSDVSTPNERLAGIIANALAKAGLVSLANLEDSKRKIAAGKAKAEDWNHWIESAQRNSERSAQRMERSGDE
jgi:hypothetical protein